MHAYTIRSALLFRALKQSVSKWLDKIRSRSIKKNPFFHTLHKSRLSLDVVTYGMHDHVGRMYIFEIMIGLARIYTSSEEFARSHSVIFHIFFVFILFLFINIYLVCLCVCCVAVYMLGEHVDTSHQSCSLQDSL